VKGGHEARELLFLKCFVVIFVIVVIVVVVVVTPAAQCYEGAEIKRSRGFLGSPVLLISCSKLLVSCPPVSR
jgi:hypothetical protein